MSVQDNTTISLIVPKSLLAQVDQLAKRDYVSRSGLIRHAVLEYVRQSGIGETEVINQSPTRRTPPKPKNVTPKPQKDIKKMFKKVAKKHPGVYADDIELLEFLEDYEQGKL